MSTVLSKLCSKKKQYDKRRRLTKMYSGEIMEYLHRLHDLFFEATEYANDFSDDTETKVGAVAINPLEEGPFFKINAANTFIQGAKGLPSTRPDKYQYIVHAEANLVNFSARIGASLEEKVVVCTLSPCQNCIRTLFQAGVREIYYKDLHRDHNPVMLDIKVTEEAYGPYTKMILDNYE